MEIFEKVEKIGYHSNLSFENDTERGFKESLSIALGYNLNSSNILRVYGFQIIPFTI